MAENGPQALRDLDGNVVGYFILPEELAELRKRQETLIRQLRSLLHNATLEKRVELQTFLDTLDPPDEPTILNS